MRDGVANRPGESLAATAARLGPWFHNVHLPDGTQTAPDHPFGDFPACKWREIGGCLPADMRGMHALDIGCNAGFYSFELAARGAQVTAIDSDRRYLDQARWLAQVFDLEPRVRFEQRQVYSLLDERRTFDLILFMGVFYHLRYPLLALDILARLRPTQLVFQSLTTADVEEHPRTTHLTDLRHRSLLDKAGWPKMAFVEDRLLDDPTNWWVPNASGIKAMLRSAGFRVATEPGHEILVCEPDPAFAEDPQVRNQMEAAVSAAGRG